MADVGTNPFHGVQSNTVYAGTMPALDRYGLVFPVGLVKLLMTHNGTAGSTAVPIEVTKGAINETTLVITSAALDRDLWTSYSTYNEAWINVVTGNADVTLTAVSWIRYNTVTQVASLIYTNTVSIPMTVGTRFTSRNAWQTVSPANDVAFMVQYHFTNAAAHAASVFEIIPNQINIGYPTMNMEWGGATAISGKATVYLPPPNVIFWEKFQDGLVNQPLDAVDPDTVGLSWELYPDYANNISRGLRKPAEVQGGFLGVIYWSTPV